MENKIDGYMTLPVEAGHEDLVIKLAEKWQADALRDSDGTTMPDVLAERGGDIYSTICLVRADQDFADEHPEYLHRKYLISFPVTASEDKKLTINPLSGFSKDKYVLDSDSAPGQWWEVRDRTAGTVIDPSKWSFNDEDGVVEIQNSIPYHEYTVSFLVRQIWDSVSMYNHLTNGWTGRRIKSLDPYHKECRAHLKEYFAQWLKDHPNTTVVRFTTFAFNFVIDSGEKNQDIYRDWLGYGETVSPQALDDFEKHYGYRLTPEDFVDEGYYNATYKVPSRRYRDWMDFINKFVVEFSRELTDMAHEAGKKCAMFQGDHWIGTEPFSEGYNDIGIDINVGAVEDGVALRRLSDSKGDQVKEARFYPYFFPDVFQKGNDPVQGSLDNWRKIRRALLQYPIDRIGYGGYLSLAADFPDFIDHVSDISSQFAAYKLNSGGSHSRKIPVKVGILNSWGEWRSWLQNPVRDQRFHVPSRPDIMEFVGSNPLESLAGLPFDISFFSFDDIIDSGIPEGLDVIINMGDADSSWSGGEHWENSRIIESIRRFVGNGGALLGIGDPSAVKKNGRFFQLGDILGLEKETALTMGRVAAPIEVSENHYLSSCLTGTEDFGNPSYVYPQSENMDVIVSAGQHIAVAANTYGKGRSVYLGNLPYSSENARFLQQALIWLGKLDETDIPWITPDPEVDCSFYPETKMVCIVNNSDTEKTGKILTESGNYIEYSLHPLEWSWKKTD